MSDVTTAAPGELTFGDRERAVLEFERLRWSAPGRKEKAIKDRFGLSSVRYYQLLNRIIDMPEALGWDPPHVYRLQRLRQQRQGLRRRTVDGVDRQP